VRGLGGYYQWPGLTGAVKIVTACVANNAHCVHDTQTSPVQIDLCVALGSAGAGTRRVRRWATGWGSM
jgi:hypothetical protein